MNAFDYRNGQMYADDVPVTDLARRFGTPLFIYSRSHIRQQYRGLVEAMAPVKPLVCYSVKANSNLAVIQTLASEGAGFDIVSGGELFRVIKAGAPASKIVYAGVGKTTSEIDFALQSDILFFTVESEPEAIRIGECARRLGRKGRIAFRVNPDVDPHTHKFISTGKKENKFGLDIERAMHAYAMAANIPGLEIVGLHLHIGSQILHAPPFTEALRKVSGLCHDLRARFPSFRHIDIGGGLGIDYKPDQQALAPSHYAAAVLPVLLELGLEVILEPGRFIVGNSGILVCRVEYVKDSHFKKFVVVDAGMNDLIRPVLYDAYHQIQPVRQTNRPGTGDLVGPICESGDFFAQDRELPEALEGDFLAVMSAGAYGFTMSSTYNSRRRAAEIMVDGARFALVRERETWDDLIRGEKPFPA